MGIKVGLNSFDAGQSQQALKAWRIGFWDRQGRTLVEALSTIHSLVYNPM
jgi:hypothetical protein